ncbi:hypothetical protein DPMN_150881 [Dreissena polymorpha]|uniref:C-type lectin domain-containing protein n=1 Tax=Dreissena polymorpha TaxID=45954 RepID=A0A9D4FE83_DREPO|nr:hypothetical protein DPMN_150881 [Dreissena polymorpha]
MHGAYTSACEYGWVILDSHCYKFNMIGETSSEAVTECSKHDAYTVTIETVEEMERVLAAATNISEFVISSVSFMPSSFSLT